MEQEIIAILGCTIIGYCVVLAAFLVKVVDGTEGEGDED